MAKTQSGEQARYAKYLDARLEMHLKKSDCVSCGVDNDNAHRLCDECNRYK